MRIRSIRPEFWSSEDVAAMDWHTRLVFIGLWSYVDDNGVGRDNERLIVADLFPLDDDPRESVARVSRALSTLFEGGQITRYEVAGKAYLHIDAWTEHQRIDKRAKDRYPLPTCENAHPRETVATPSRDLRDTLGVGEGEKGRRGEGEKNSRPAEPDAFEAWWSSWPKKEKKVDAQRAYAKALKVIDADKLDRLTAEWFEARPTIEAKFIPLAASWLNGRRWEDEPPTNATRSATASNWDRLPTAAQLRAQREREDQDHG